MLPVKTFCRQSWAKVCLKLVSVLGSPLQTVNSSKLLSPQPGSLALRRRLPRSFSDTQLLQLELLCTRPTASKVLLPGLPLCFESLSFGSSVLWDNCLVSLPVSSTLAAKLLNCPVLSPDTNLRLNSGETYSLGYRSDAYWWYFTEKRVEVAFPCWACAFCESCIYVSGCHTGGRFAWPGGPWVLAPAPEGFWVAPSVPSLPPGQWAPGAGTGCEMRARG